MPNPYSYSTVVPDPSMFFGREKILGDLCTRLRNMQSTSVVGLRRIGKSSLLCQLARTIPGRLGQNYIPLYIDLQDPRCRTVGGFVSTITKNIGGVLGIQVVDTSPQEGASRQGYLVRLRQILNMSFGEGELNTLCFDLGVDYESLPGKGKAGKARELVTHLERCGRIPDLVRIGAQRRPKACWEDAPEAPRGILSAVPFERVREIFKTNRLRGRLKVSSVTDMASFSEMLDILDENDMRPVLCLDEFEEFMRHPEEFDDDFLEALRPLGEHSKVAMVTASRTPLVDLIRAGQLTSPLHNIFPQIELGLLEHDAAGELRRTPFERDGIPLTPEHEVLIEELGGRHPFFLQMACHHLYETFPGPQDKWADIVCERFNHDAELHFDWLWNHLHARERAALGVVVNRVSLSEETKIPLKRLARLGVVERRRGEWQPFSRAFAEHIRQYLIPARRRNLLGRLRDMVRRS